jgi:predicted metal-dependent hydrolase
MAHLHESNLQDYSAKIRLDNKTQYVNGEIHLFRGNKSVLKIEKSNKPYIRFYDNTIEIGLEKTENALAVKMLLYRGYKVEALKVFPEIFRKILEKYNSQIFRPSGLVIRTMKRRWGSCSHKGIITLSTELIKLPDMYIEYVIIHELCHLKHHNHGTGYYKLLSELFPEWKSIRKELRKYIQ